MRYPIFVKKKYPVTLSLILSWIYKWLFVVHFWLAANCLKKHTIKPWELTIKKIRAANQPVFFNYGEPKKKIY